MLLKLATSYITRRPLQYIMTIFVVAISISLTIAIVLISASFRKGIIDAAMPFDMIIGAKGSPNQLIMNTIFLQDVPIGNIDHSLYRQFQEDERVARLIPFAFGDNYRGYRIVGSTHELFSLRPAVNAPGIFELSDGVFFTDNYQAVIGSEVAKMTGLKPGDTFTAAHGLFASLMFDDDDDDHHHDDVYEVVGVLKPMHRPYDMGIFTSIDTVWEMHHTHGHNDITAFMVTPKDYIGLMQMYQETNNGIQAQAAFPGQVMGNLFSIMGNVENVLYLISYLVIIIGFLTIIISLYWSILNRKWDHATLRAIGAGKNTIFTLIIIESLLIMFISGIAGLVIGHCIAYGVSFYIRTLSYVYAAINFDIRELHIVFAYTLAGVVFSILPAMGVYRQNAATNLSSL